MTSGGGALIATARGTTAGRRLRAVAAACLLLVALATGYAVVAVDQRAAVLVALIPLSILLLLRPSVPAAIGVAVIPLAQAVVTAPGLKLAGTDLLFTVALAGVLVPAVLSGELRGIVRQLAPLRAAFLAYVVVLVLVLLAHPSLSSVLGGVQRAQIVLVPTLIGLAALRGRAVQWGVRGYLVLCLGLTAVLLTSLGSVGVLGLQKNPLGQFLAGGVLVALAAPGVPPVARLVTPLLAGGLLLTQSRGAVVGLLAGVVLLVVVRTNGRARQLLIVVPFAVGIVGVFQFLPDDVADRLTSLRGGAGTEGSSTIDIRSDYREDALEVIRANPWQGVGINQYRGGDRANGTYTDDPHNVLLLETAEGGLPLGAALTLLAAGSVVVCLRRQRLSQWALLAAAVQTSTFVHALFDVYWVRATPVLGWLLVGLTLATCSSASDPREDREAVTVGA